MSIYLGDKLVQLGGSDDNLYSYLGKNPKEVFKYAERLTLAELGFDPTTYTSGSVTLRAQYANVITEYQTKPDKYYAVRISFKSSVKYIDGYTPVYPEYKNYIANQFSIVRKSRRSFLTSGKEQSLLTFSASNSIYKAGNSKILSRKLGNGLTSDMGNNIVTLNLANTVEPIITVKTSGIKLSPHAWVMNPNSIVNIDQDKTTLEIEYTILEMDTSFIDSFEFKLMDEIGFTEE